MRSLAALELGITAPRFKIAYSLSGLAENLNDWERSPILKADFGGRGTQVLSIPHESCSKSIDLGSSWYPVLLQEQILGTEVGVEAQFIVGVLVDWTYSHVLRTAGHFGPSRQKDI